MICFKAVLLDYHLPMLPAFNMLKAELQVISQPIRCIILLLSYLCAVYEIDTLCLLLLLKMRWHVNLVFVINERAETKNNFSYARRISSIFFGYVMTCSYANLDNANINN